MCQVILSNYYGQNNDIMIRLTLLHCCYQNQTCDVGARKRPMLNKNMAEFLVWLIEYLKCNHSKNKKMKAINDPIYALRILIAMIYRNYYAKVSLFSWQSKDFNLCAFPWKNGEWTNYKHKYVKMEYTAHYPAGKGTLDNLYDSDFIRTAHGSPMYFYGFRKNNPMYFEFFENMDEIMYDLILKHWEWNSLVFLRESTPSDSESPCLAMEGQKVKDWTQDVLLAIKENTNDQS